MSKKDAEDVTVGTIAWLLAIVAAFAILATLGTHRQTAEAASTSDQAVLGETVAVDAAVPGGGERLLSDSATFALSRAQNTLTSSLSWDSILRPQDEDRNGATASFAQRVGSLPLLQNLGVNIDMVSPGSPIVFESGDLSPGARLNETMLEEGHTNGQTVEVVYAGAEELHQPLTAFEFTSDNATTPFDAPDLGSVDIAGVLNPSGRPFNYNLPQANPWNANISYSGGLSGWDFFHERTGSGEVIASSANFAPAEGLVPEAEAYAQEAASASQDKGPAGSSEVSAKVPAEGGDSSANWLFAALGLGAIALVSVVSPSPDVPDERR